MIHGEGKINDDNNSLDFYNFLHGGLFGPEEDYYMKNDTVISYQVRIN